MRIAVWKTGHEIADRVADSLVKGLPNAELLPCATENHRIGEFSTNIVYGILRGAAEVFKGSSRWFNVDRGYFRPSHYDGYYRISYRGTQQTSGWPEPDYERLEALKLEIRPWRGFDESKPVLVIPPTGHVFKFFDIQSWPVAIGVETPRVVRTKGDTSPIRFEDYNYVLTFNSSVGWQALMAGIPCISDPTHSIVGSWFQDIPLDSLAEKQLQDRDKLFATMAASQFTLQELEQGKAWSLINHYTSGSAMMAGKLSPPMLPPTPSADGLKARFQSTI